MFVLLCRKPPYWCGKFWKFGPLGWFERQKHEETCKGRRG
jgi:hypothetical protein